MPTYGDEYTVYHCHMISVVVFFNSNALKSMLVDYAITEVSCFDDYSYAAPRAKTMGGNGVSTFLLQVYQCNRLPSNKYYYSNTYCRSIAEVILFEIRFQGY